MLKATRKALSGIMWMARGTTTMVGLVVMLAMVLGAGSTALAAVPGDPFKLGRINSVGAITQLVGATNDAMLRIDNDSKGTDATALDLEVNPKKPPMRINSFTKVDRLNADLLDGRESNQFVTITDKASDSDKLDGKDSTSFADGTNGKANDADKLDGLDSTQIGINGYVLRDKSSTFDSSSTKLVTAECPPGTLVIGGGARVSPDSTDPNVANAPIALRTSSNSFNGVQGWDARALEFQPYDFGWSLTARVICAKVDNP